MSKDDIRKVMSKNAMHVDAVNANCNDHFHTYIYVKCVKILSYYHLFGGAVLFSLCTYSISDVDAANTKENRHIKECIYFSKGMSMQLIQNQTTYST